MFAVRRSMESTAVRHARYSTPPFCLTFLLSRIAWTTNNSFCFPEIRSLLSLG